MVAVIERQKIFFVATAAKDGRVNLSPKGYDALRILGPKRLAWLNLTGSGNETAAHLLDSNRLTLMFCAFDDPPLILRLYGSANTIHRDESGWSDAYSHFEDFVGARQIFDMHIESIQTSCGFGVPKFEFIGQRSKLLESAEKRGSEGIAEYWEAKNRQSIDGKPTGMPAPSVGDTRTDASVRRPDQSD